ncbi:MAG: class I SAM-dependent methyltransferase [Dehalococcoidia bacterium]|nr:class I SAM-dependent methyltransferase [Dehalococcoidia bacterium]
MARNRRSRPAEPASDLAQRYDAIPYPTAPQPATHPDHLAVVARLCGLETAPVESARVLEIGCGDGQNILSLAVALPHAHFTGLDVAPGPLARGAAAARDLDLTNVNLFEMDLQSAGTALGDFDYVLAHGLYSWVPPAVGARLLAVCCERLAPNGVALVSYNTLPGGHLRRMVRDILQFEVHSDDPPEAQVEAARGMLDLLEAGASHVAGQPDPFRRLLLEQARLAASRSDGGLFHDDLAPVCEPFYVTEFVAEAERHGLQFLGEADYFEMQEDRFGEDLGSLLRAVAAESVVLKEQYVDFLACRQFRMTLLCHEGISLDRTAGPAALPGLFVSSDAPPGDQDEDGAAVFGNDERGFVSAREPLALRAMQLLYDRRPLALPFAEILAAAVDREGGPRDEDADRLARFLYRTFAAGVIDLHTGPSAFILEPGTRPRASPLARLQLQTGSEVTTLRHTGVALDDRAAALLALLDGTRNRQVLSDGLGGSALDEIDADLRQLGRLGLLIG